MYSGTCYLCRARYLLPKHLRRKRKVVLALQWHCSLMVYIMIILVLEIFAQAVLPFSVHTLYSLFDWVAFTDLSHSRASPTVTCHHSENQLKCWGSLRNWAWRRGRDTGRGRPLTPVLAFSAGLIKPGFANGSMPSFSHSFYGWFVMCLNWLGQCIEQKPYITGRVCTGWLSRKGAARKASILIPPGPSNNI